MRQTLATLAALITLAAPAAAQQTSGTITATMDLDPRIWQIDRAPQGELRSFWRETEDGSALRLHGEGSPGAVAGVGDVTLEFDVTSGAARRAENLVVTLSRAEGEAPLIATPQNTDIALTGINVAAGEMVVSGSFNAVMVPGGTDRLTQADAADAVTLDGNFQATVQKAEPGTQGDSAAQ